MRKVGDKAVADTNHESLQHKSWKSETWFVSQTFMIWSDFDAKSA